MVPTPQVDSDAKPETILSLVCKSDIKVANGN